MVYFILPVKDQGRWVYHFIDELTVASLLTGDTNFHVVVADFASQDIDIAEAFNTSLFRSRHTIRDLKHQDGRWRRGRHIRVKAEARPASRFTRLSMLSNTATAT